MRKAFRKEERTHSQEGEGKENQKRKRKEKEKDRLYFDRSICRWKILETESVIEFINSY